MTTIPPLSEALRNQVLAALDERAARLETRIRIWQDLMDGKTPNLLPTEDLQRAVVWNIAALHETKEARELIGEAEATPEQADDVTAAKAYADWQENEKAGAWGR